MRPIKLTMTAFGPYRDSETIDFSRLEDKRLFVISGNTGAGKTTIFDAICYALYDSASGEDRSETRMLRSHFAEDEVHTSVDFTFAVGKRTYRIYRRMAHRKGTNKSETGEKAELYETTSGQEVPIAERFLKKEVNEKVEAILGLTKEQFSQIVMLPQGEFRKLLTSDTENKEEILRHIFRTQLYERLTDRFQQKSRELKDTHRDARSRLDVQMKHAQESLPPREYSLLWQTFQQEYYNPAQIVDGLAQEAEYYERLKQSAEAKKTAADAELERKEADLRAAFVLHGRFEELANKRARQAELELEKGAVAEKEFRLAQAEKAARIEPYEEHAEKAARDVESKRLQVEAKQRDVEAARIGLEKAEARHGQEEAREPERKLAELELQRLTDRMPVVQTIDSQRNELASLAAEEKNCSTQLTALEAQMASNRQSKQALAARIKEMEAETAVLPDKQESLERVRRQYKLMKHLSELERQVGDLALLETERERALRQIKSEHDRLEQLWIEGQAGLLAAHLHDGQPCPVCGSAEHPHKAAAGEQMPSRDELQKAKDKLRYIEQELSTAKAQAAAARSTKDHGSKELEEAGIKPNKNLSDLLVLVEQEGRQLAAETDRLKQLVAQLPSQRKDAEQLDELHEAWMKEKERLTILNQNLAVEIGKKQSLLDKELEQIPESLRSPELLARRISEQKQHADHLAEAWKAAVQQLQEMKMRFAEEKASANQLGEQWKEAETNYKQAADRFQVELTKAGFPSAEAYREAKQPERTRQAYQREIEQFRQSFSALEQQIAELEKELADKQKVDLAALQQGVAEWKAELERIQMELQTAIRCKQEAERHQKAILSANEMVKELEARLEQVLDLYQTLKGDNPLKISFERYILIEFLEQILHAANVRLLQLSNGQFTLQRSDRLETRGKQSGLGLDVFDAYTGQNRDVKSLSGGEKFNASLCLALGMTDVIQAHQGGVSIEMMFIDEGFGSLDEDSLNKAIATLIDLQRTGRMIGVISHVAEIKEAFPAVLEVHKTKEGYSRTAILVK